MSMDYRKAAYTSLKPKGVSGNQFQSLQYTYSVILGI